MIFTGRKGDIFCSLFITWHAPYDTLTYTPVSYTHLDVYKRQAQARGVQPSADPVPSGAAMPF